VNRRSLLAASASFFLAPSFALAATPAKATLQLIKSPTCDCCTGHAEYLRAHGYVVDVVASSELPKLRSDLGVPGNLVGCHLIRADGYLIEGHVPAGAIDKLLSERPAIKGISVPGMPLGSPGMSGEKVGPLVVLTIGDGAPEVYFTE
jgi:hypothetical protein